MGFSGLIDIHSHILPGVDDGAKTIEQSIKMLRFAAEEGIEKIILTPHQKEDHRSVTPKGMEHRINLLKQQMEESGIGIQIFPGNEIFYRHGLGELLDEGKMNTLAGSRYVLIEFFPGEDYRYIRNSLNRVTSFGYWPIVAHVERCVNVSSSIDQLIDLKEDTGCLYQMNASSLMGEAGFRLKAASRKMIKEDLVDFIATDAHNDEKRAPKLQQCAYWLAKKTGEANMRRIMTENPTAIIDNNWI